ncbi:uncharacterized protein LOC133489907 isoform X4 [Phyllopteryx taeniolatus]|uniref:uncharacterized protein LOC133489907 isoform X4 n=1 Tax=Phyllopteryx taeniolatus TaxID=161469 RepID=UPI002AD50E01|nr:uncharacterized protein LOC133489907 isoform X4 [Phyllopteryx taeniolatus]
MQEVAKRAVLVSVANFEPGVSLGARHGAKEDTRRLHRVLSKLDFQVDIHQDLNSHEIYRLFRKVPCDHLHQSNVTTCVLGADGAPVWLSRVFAYFDRADVERMAKVFLIQACHGDATVDSCGERESTDTVDSRQRGRHVRHRRRWLDYQAVGKRLHGTRFVAFKVPLNQSLNRQLMPSQTFGPWELLDAIRRDGQELGLVVDLTFTTRYYRPQDLPVSLGYVKVLTKGHVVPADNAIFAFKRAVRRFLRDNGDNDKLIGVHCTHGLNRTGYMICRYLIDVDGMDPAEAIKSTRAWTTSVCRRRRKDEPTRDAPTVACLKTGVGAAPTDLSRQEPKVDAHPSGPIMKAPDITGPRISTPLNTPPSMSTTTPTNPLITAPSMSALSVASPHFWAAFFPHRPHSPLPTSTDRRCPVPPASWFGPETFGRPPRPPSLATPPVGAISKGVRMRGGAEISCGIF